jgi:transcriptional regulator with XRE-family HTH domain
LTQAELGARTGLDDTYISRLEHGRFGVRWATVIRIMRALDADLHLLADAFNEAEKQEPRPRTT